ncbi:MAG: oxidoreductase [Pseudomonadales bacterium]|nr:oxidoreductase [Pseudomonadales bacterium]
MTTQILHPWAEEHVPDQSSKTIVVTGANSGIGFAAAQALAYKNAKVVMACRNLSKAEDAKQQILDSVPNADIDIVKLDLADLKSVEACAKIINEKYDQLDCLINNAGLGWIERTETADGFEMQIGANHLGHFALTSQLLGLLKSTPNSRVVSVASLAHYWGRIKFGDLQLNQGYSRVKGYGQSKLANLLFGLELQRFFEKNSLDIKSVVVHPGMSGTNIANSALEAGNHKLLSKITNAMTPYMSQSPQLGCLPTLHAATSANVKGGDYFGPKHAFEVFGTPAKARIAKHARDIATAAKLWTLSEELTQVDYQQAIA